MARPRPQGGEASRARSTPLAGKAGGLGRLGVLAGERRRAGGAGAEDRVPAGGRAAGGGRGSEAARARWPFPWQNSQRRRSGEALPPVAGLRASGAAGDRAVGGWASAGEGAAGRQENQQPQPQPAGEERCAEKDGRFLVWGAGGGGTACVEKGSGARRTRAFVRRAKRLACQEWDSNPRLQGRLRPERSALDRSAILTAGLVGRVAVRLAGTRRGASSGALGGTRGAPRQAGRHAGRQAAVRCGCGRSRRAAAGRGARLRRRSRAGPYPPAPLLARRAPSVSSQPRSPSGAPFCRRHARLGGQRRRALGVSSAPGVRVPVGVAGCRCERGGWSGVRSGRDPRWAGGGVGRQPESPRAAGRQDGRRRPR